MIFIYFIVTLLTICVLISLRQRRKNALPPGPRGIPFLGNMLQIGVQPHFAFCKWAKIFPKMYTMHLAHRPTLVVNDVKLYHELFQKTAATGRFKPEIFQLTTRGDYGIGNSEGATWIEQKQFCMRALNKFGFARGVVMEPIILNQVEDLSNWIIKEQTRHGKVYLNDQLKHSTGNVLLGMLIGDKVKVKSKDVNLMDEWMKHLQISANTGVLFFSWIRHIAPVRSGYQGFKKICDEIYNYVETCFKEHVSSRRNGEPPRDMIDAFLEKIENCQDQNSSFYGTEGWKHAVGSLIGLLLAAEESTGVIINWILFYLSSYQNVQQELQDEIDRVVGKSRDPCYEDKAKMPFLEAIIQESLRFSSNAPFGAMHELTDIVTLDGYHLPKGLLLIPNIFHMHFDKAVWGDPENFRPSRFIENKSLKDSVLMFQPGKRSCPGERIARDTMFLVVAKLCQKFTFSTDPNVENCKEYLQPVIGYHFMPKKLNLVCSSRL